MSNVYIYGQFDDIVSVRLVGDTNEYRIKIGDAWLYLPPLLAAHLHVALADALNTREEL